MIRMKHTVTGAFEVKLAPQVAYNGEPGALLGRMSLDKHYHGSLSATARGEMLTAMTPTQGSAGYVAVERVDGSLAGRSGSFSLLHRGIMNRGAPELSITVVPDSGTGELKGLIGSMSIRFEAGGKHVYELTYEFGDCHDHEAGCGGH